MSFFHEINVTELRDGITSLHGIHEDQYLASHRLMKASNIAQGEME